MIVTSLKSFEQVIEIILSLTNQNRINIESLIQYSLPRSVLIKLLADYKRWKVWFIYFNSLRHYSSMTSQGLMCVLNFENSRLWCGKFGLNCSPSSRETPVFLMASRNILIRSFFKSSSDIWRKTSVIPVSRQRWPEKGHKKPKW